MTNKIIAMLRSVNAVFIFVDSFMPKQRITVKSFWIRSYFKLLSAHLKAKVLFQTKRNPRMEPAGGPEMFQLNVNTLNLCFSHIHPSCLCECFTHFSVHHAVHIITVTFGHAAHAWKQCLVLICVLGDHVVSLTDAVGEDHAPAEDEADKLSNANVSVHIGRPCLGNPCAKLSIAQT